MRFPVFKVGRHIDSKGNPFDCTSEKLDAIVRLYNNRGPEDAAPIVIGHPTLSAPAWGWVKKINRIGDELIAETKNDVPEFVQWVTEGRYKNRSIALNPDLSVRHIGFLGGTPPAVKGLGPVQFSTEESITIEFCDAAPTIGRIFQRLRDFLIEKFGQDVADRILSSWDIENLLTMNQPEMMQAGMSPAFAEASPEEKARAARAKKYGIAVKDGGNLTKPADYKDIADGDFADPVNYRYPIDETHIQAALSYWGKPKNREAYDAEEIKTITARIMTAAQKHGIKVDAKTWNFNEGGKSMSLLDEIKALFKKEGIPLEGQAVTFSEAEVKTKIEAAEKAAREAAEATAAANLRKQTAEAEAKTFCEGLKANGRYLPAWDKLGVPKLLAHLTAQENEVYEFAEKADGKEPVKETPAQAFKGFLAAMPKMIEFKEVAGAGAEFSAGADDLVAAYQKDNPKASYKEAFLAVSKKNPHLFKKGGAKQ